MSAAERLGKRISALDDVVTGRSRFSSAHMAWTVDGREFAHLHPPSDGSFHMILSQSDCDHVLTQGWGELHPLAARGEIRPTVLMVFAPRNRAELDIVLAIADAAHRYARTPTA